MTALVTARALIRSHHGPEVLCAVAGVVGALLMIGLQAVPSLDHGYPLHLFTLGPGIVAVVASVATSNKLAELTLTVDRRLALFRGVWCGAVVAASCLLIWPVAVSMHRQEIVGVTGLLVALTFAASTMVGSAAWIVGAANTVAAMLLPRVYPDADPVAGWLRSAGSRGELEIVTVTLASALLFAVSAGQATPRLRRRGPS